MPTRDVRQDRRWPHRDDDTLMFRSRAASLFAKVRPYSAFSDRYRDGYVLRRLDQVTENKFVFIQKWRTSRLRRSQPASIARRRTCLSGSSLMANAATWGSDPIPIFRWQRRVEGRQSTESYATTEKIDPLEAKEAQRRAQRLSVAMGRGLPRDGRGVYRPKRGGLA